jgi:signal transduction histidine kinase
LLVLTILKGPDKGRRFELPDNEPQQIGRTSETLPLSDQTVSRRHAEMTPDDGKWWIRDLDSSNGTWVNATRVIQPQILRTGDQIRAGNTILLFGQEAVEMRRSGVHVASEDVVDASVSHTIASNDDSMIMAVPEPSEAAVMQLKVIYELLQVIGTTVDRQELLERVMDLIFAHFKADRGFVLLTDGTSDQRPDPAVVRHRVKPRDEHESRITVSRTIVQHVIRNRVGVLSSNAMSDKRFASGDSVQYYGIRSALCVPILFKDRLFGVIHIDSQVANYTFTEDQNRLLTAIGQQSGLAMANMALYEERVQRERLAAVGHTVASLSHSIKNILQGLRGGADVVEIGLKKDNKKVIASGWEIVSRNLERIMELTSNMLAYSKQRKPEVEIINLPQLLDEIIDLEQAAYDKKKVALLVDFDRDMPPVSLDPVGIHQAVLNLVSNALDAVEAETGAVTVRCEYQSDPQRVWIHVTDNGDGIEPAARERIFLPFHSTKGLRGTGLGLAVTKKIVEEHGGVIRFESSPKNGTTFTIELPCTPDAVKSPADTHGAG